MNSSWNAWCIAFIAPCVHRHPYSIDGHAVPGCTLVLAAARLLTSAYTPAGLRPTLLEGALTVFARAEQDRQEQHETPWAVLLLLLPAFLLKVAPLADVWSGTSIQADVECLGVFGSN